MKTFAFVYVGLLCFVILNLNTASPWSPLLLGAGVVLCTASLWWARAICRPLRIGLIAAALLVGGMAATGSVWQLTRESALLHLEPNDQKVALTLFDTIERKGITAAMAELVQTAKERPVDTHRLSHAIGMYGYLTLKDPALSFAGCTADFRDGCFHGVMQTYLQVFVHTDGRPMPQALEGICDFAQGSSVLTEHCWHGLGHGLALGLGSNNYRTTLAYCDAASPRDYLDTCYYGIFMEARLAALPVWRNGQSQEYIRADDPHYPCNTLLERHQDACYIEQVKTLLDFNNRDFNTLGATCTTTGGPPCYYRVGTLLANTYEGKSLDEPVRQCSSAGEGRDRCVLGIVSNAYSRHNESLSVCASFGPALKISCYETVGQHFIRTLPEPKVRELSCQPSEPAFLKYCLRGLRG